MKRVVVRVEGGLPARRDATLGGGSVPSEGTTGDAGAVGSKAESAATSAGTGAIGAALERALTELPAGTAESRLTQFCGRLWDLLTSSEFLDAHRLPVAFTSSAQDEIGAALVSCVGAVAALVTEGTARGEFFAASPKGVARLVVSSLSARALWCGRGAGLSLCGSCPRAVTETLDLIWPALSRPESEGGSRRPHEPRRS